MKKIEIIWRELLFQVLEKGNNHFVQQELAQKFNFSTSTIFQALKSPRKMGAVRVGGREFIVSDPEKLLYHWASVRDLNKEIIYQTQVDLPIMEIENSMVPKAIFACFSAYRLKYNEAAADYDKVYIYLKTQNSNLEEIKQRFPQKKGRPNLIVLKADKYLADYGRFTSIGQTFVDLWNLPDWFAKEFVNTLKEKIDELLS